MQAGRLRYDDSGGPSNVWFGTAHQAVALPVVHCVHRCPWREPMRFGKVRIGEPGLSPGHYLEVTVMEVGKP